MQNHNQRDNATSNVLAWSTHGANVEPSVEEDAGADADEPPDPEPVIAVSPVANRFKKTAIRRENNHHESLLTKALQSHSEDEGFDSAVALARPKQRRRSMTSNISLASTADLTSDTGITTPARTISPSPSLSHVGFAPLAVGRFDSKSGIITEPVIMRDGAGISPNDGHPQAMAPANDSTAPVAEKKRCISFACAARPKPVQNDSAIMPPPPKPPITVDQTPRPQATPRRSCIKFACPARPTAPQTPPQKEPAQPELPVIKTPATPENGGSPSTVRKLRSPSTGQSRTGRSITPRRSPHSPVARRSQKYLTAESQDLQVESSRFHEFASDEVQEDDWIRQDKNATRRRLTIDDTLTKELAIRRLGKEAEEEAEQEEEEEADETVDGDDNDELDDDDDNAEDEDDDEDDPEDGESGYGTDDDASDGYRTDSEVGFASSDDEDNDLVLWTTRRPGQLANSGETPVFRRPSFGAQSDSSAYSGKPLRQGKPKHLEVLSRFRPGTPELPDSTDFVCGTLDEDRPLEDAYMSCIAARKAEKLRLIPQDIDPSFPTSDPEDEDNEEMLKSAQHDSDDHVWLHGEFEDIHHEHERVDRRKKKSDSPKRYHSPPPKHRGRSPRRLFDHYSPRRLRSPPPRQAMTSPPASLAQTGAGIAFKSIAWGRGATYTKSLPRAPAVFHHAKSHRRSRANTMVKDKHVRGAIDIVKGLEQKRQRRKEKFQQKYCNRARKGQIHEKRPQPGEGAERMKELGLLIAGKVGQGNYVLSF